MPEPIIEKFTYGDPHENLGRMAWMASAFAADTLESGPSSGQHFLSIESAKRLFSFVQERYLLEEEEQFLRPRFFAAIGGDCDDQADYVAAWYLARGLSPENIFYVEVAEQPNYFEHIIAAIQWGGEDDIFVFDALPGQLFDTVTGKQVRVTRMSTLL